MQIIAIEGLDKSGKNTLVKDLELDLKSQGYSVETMEYHNYDSPTGKIIWDWLRGNYEADQKTIELIMAADKHAQKKKIEDFRINGVDYLLIDRYILSQKVYYFSNIAIDREFDASVVNYRKSLSFLEAILSDLPQPNLNIILNISPETSMSRKGQHGENDKYEENKQLLETVSSYYLGMASQFTEIIKVIEAETKTNEDIKIEALKLIIND